MKRLLLLALLAAGCHRGGATYFGTARAFAGTWGSQWGDVVFVAHGDDLEATFPGGSMKCRVDGDRILCDWEEGSANGQAIFVRQSDTLLAGTWGSGLSATDGGPWALKKK